MNTPDAIFARASYRVAFRPDHVPRGDLKTILEAGFAAPSDCNEQTATPRSSRSSRRSSTRPF